MLETFVATSERVTEMYTSSNDGDGKRLVTQGCSDRVGSVLMQEGKSAFGAERKVKFMTLVQVKCNHDSGKLPSCTCASQISRTLGQLVFLGGREGWAVLAMSLKLQDRPLRVILQFRPSFIGHSGHL